VSDLGVGAVLSTTNDPVAEYAKLSFDQG